MSTSASAELGGSATFKARDVEELVDFYLHRRVANVVLRLFAPTRITPDQVTVLSGLTAMVAGAIVGTAGTTRPWQAVVGGCVFFFSIVFDCVDGQLARLRKTSSFAGRALDGYTDVVSVTSIMVGHLFWLLSHGCPFWLTQVVGWSAAVSFKWHAHTYDHVKNLYLYNTEPHAPGSLPSFPNLDEIESERQEHLQAGRRFSAAMCTGLRKVTEGQRRGLKDHAGLDRPGMQTPTERQLYRRRFHVFMRLWSFNGTGTHLFIYTVATLLAPLYAYAPLVAWGILALPMNLYTLVLKAMEPRLEARLAEDLAAA